MISVLSPELFITIPWKNGQGETIELAMNYGGHLDDFVWRLSMASVVEDGVFSDFSGYQRNLILIEGNGINLQHDDSKIDKLNHNDHLFLTYGGYVPKPKVRQPRNTTTTSTTPTRR